MDRNIEPMKSICIIGAGECGTRAAFALREGGFEDRITLINGEACNPYERPALSKPENAKLGDTNTDEQKLFYREISPIQKYADNNINLLTNVHATSIDREDKNVVLSNNSKVNYDKLLLATGATPRMVESNGGAVMVMRTNADAEQIYALAKQAKNAVIIGAGLIGLELAAELCSKGIKVTVVEMTNRAMARAVPLNTAAKIVERHILEGVSFKFNSKIVEIFNDGIILDDDTKLPTDLTVAAIGVTPNTTLASSADLTCDNGISVSSRLQTNDPNIYAAGDCANFDHPTYGKIRQETWRNAQEQGQYAASCMLGTATDFEHIAWFWSDQYDLGLQVAGRPNENDIATIRELGDSCGNGASITFYTDQNGQLTAAVGLGIGNKLAKDIRLAEMLIAKNKTPSLSDLADPTLNLKKLLRA